METGDHYICAIYAFAEQMVMPGNNRPTTLSASEMTYIVSSGALNSTHSLTPTTLTWFSHSIKEK